MRCSISDRRTRNRCPRLKSIAPSSVCTIPQSFTTRTCTCKSFGGCEMGASRSTSSVNLWPAPTSDAEENASVRSVSSDAAYDRRKPTSCGDSFERISCGANDATPPCAPVFASAPVCAGGKERRRGSAPPTDQYRSFRNSIRWWWYASRQRLFRRIAV